ncbi:MAG TPA: type II secretion system F family protein [Armatimonadota bacterium]|nr:type II secretion system F family protein [Armatimonadota bacterium]
MTIDSQKVDPSLAILIFTRQFSALVDAGRPLVHCLDTIAGSLPGPLADAVAEVRVAVGEGAVLSKVLRERADFFPPYLERMVRLGEVGGMLDETLQMAGDLFQEEWEVSRWSESPDEQRRLRILSQPCLTPDWDSLSNAERTMTIFLFCRSMSMLLSAGIPAESALEASAEMLPKEQREQARAAASGERDVSIEARIREIGFLPPLVEAMFADPERQTGLHHLLDRAAQFYRYELQWRLGASLSGGLSVSFRPDLTADAVPPRIAELDREVAFFNEALQAVGASATAIEIPNQSKCLWLQVPALLQAILALAIESGASEIRIESDLRQDSLRSMSFRIGQEIRAIRLLPSFLVHQLTGQIRVTSWYQGRGDTRSFGVNAAGRGYEIREEVGGEAGKGPYGLLVLNIKEA